MLGLPGVTDIDTSTALVTVTVVVPVRPLTIAEMTAEPVPCPVTSPVVALTLAALGVAEDHAAEFVRFWVV